ncbi:hypothetical protein PF005_g12194 [Phytophthora fragariae]|uniref:HTH CENPB-type domain-containing protein n=2 Tax=Phytophthora fragariae TaxID=53985 RepID=A0A6A3TY14_9STRA|nr:hypothetical protein PF009_g14243 [Phytophthora fragariae]KAE9005456.1 hypothetical protein PF011_g12030 [Phytophthora fragariae]KAE9107559.1 hypothetical protein PF007_g12996 [Phytophthora fragariae]KAE9143211.1 hypothetical protein PF006_g11742 [Phytophthora fragariae]KAE9208500.1 hypothetical protein PF005_g12194 [Phytophthora fragariae]
MTKTRKSYSGSQKREAVQAVQGGASTEEVGKSRGIPARTLNRWVKKASENEGDLEIKRRGPPIRLPKEAEECIFQWVVARQMMGVPVGRQATIRKASEITTLMDGKGVGDGWYRGFLSRYPELGNRRSQAVTKDRNAVTGDDITALFWSVAKVVIEHNMDASRIFNVDETAFESGRKSTCVIAFRGSRNVWHTDPTISFHLSIVACASAGGFLVPPAFHPPCRTC